MMRDPATGQPHTAHTTQPRAGRAGQPARPASTGLGNGRLADVAPTLLALMGLKQPAAMTGRPLLRTGARGS